MTRPRVVAGERQALALSDGVVAALVVGLITGVVFAAAVALADWIGIERIRQVFVSITQPLIDFLTFDKGVPAGLPLLVGASVIGGAIGGFARTAPVAVRRPVALGALAVVLMGLLQRIIPIALIQLGIEADWLYSRVTGGSTWLGALVVFAVAAALSVAWSRRGEVARQRVGSMVREQSGARLGLLVILLVAVALLPLLVGDVISDVLGSVMIYVLLGLGLNIVVGYAGLLDLGYVAFFAFGAYTTGVLTGAMLNTTSGAAEPRSRSDLNFYVARLDRGAARRGGRASHRRTGPAAARRLPGDRDPRARRDRERHHGLQVGAALDRRPSGHAGGDEGGDLRPQSAGQPAALLLPDPRLRAARAVRLVAIVDVADRSRVERACARTSRWPRRWA